MGYTDAMKKFGLAVGAVALGVACSSPAYAHPRDDQAFLKDLNQYVEVFDPAGAVDLAHRICNDLAAGFHPNQLTDVIAERQEISQHNAAITVELSSDYYCPKFELEGAVPKRKI
jgi:hypothetical protein